MQEVYAIISKLLLNSGFCVPEFSGIEQTFLEEKKMVLNKCESIGANKYEIEFTSDAAAFESAVQKAYQKEKKDITVPGFRKGKAPRAIIEKMFGKEVFHEKAVNLLLNTELPLAVEEAKLNLVDRPDVEVLSLDTAEGIVFKAICITMPEVEVSDYKGITVTKNDYTVTDELVSAKAKELCRREARIISVDDRAAQMDDTVTIDFDGTVDGDSFPGGSAKEFPLKLGSGQFIPGFEEQIVGHSVGEEFDIDVTFPEDYKVDNLSGTSAVFHIKIHEIEFEEIPELSDELVADTTEFSTISEYLDDCRVKLQEESANKVQADIETAIFKQVIENTIGDIPDVMIERKIDSHIGEFEYRLKSEGMNIQMYLDYLGMDIQTLRGNYEQRATDEVKLRLALEKIAELEGLEVSDDEVQDGIIKLSEQYNMPVDRVRTLISEDVYRMDLLTAKAADFVKENAVILDAPPAEDASLAEAAAE